VIGVLCPWGRFTSLSNFAMCGFPGGVNYFLLWLGTGRRRQKAINRVMNIVFGTPFRFYPSTEL
jgi:hypothetical protein